MTSYPIPVNSEPEAGHQAQTDYATGVRPPLPITSASVSTHEVVGTSPVASPAGTPPGMGDTVAGDVASAMTNAEARFQSHQSATPGGPGVDIGAPLTLPPVPDNAVPASSSDLYPGSGDEPVPAG